MQPAFTFYCRATIGKTADLSDYEVTAMFNRIDTDGSGTLDRQEFKERMRELGKDERYVGYSPQPIGPVACGHRAIGPSGHGP